MDPLAEFEVTTPPIKVLDVSLEITDVVILVYELPVGPIVVNPMEGVEVAIPPVRLLDTSVDMAIVFSAVDEDPVGSTEDDEL